MSRQTVSYENFSQRFISSRPDFSKQYSKIYTVRLEEMGELLETRIITKWGGKYPVSKLHTLADMQETCVVMGTLFKNQKLKPSVLKQFAEGSHTVPQPVHERLTDDTDVLYIEDELQRIQLIGDVLKVGEVVTGISCALLGRNLGRGKFQVEDFCFVDFRAQIERPKFKEDYFVVFISGINLMGLRANQTALDLFVDWLTGVFYTGGNDDSINPANIVRLIIAGNTARAERDTAKTEFQGSKKLESDNILESVTQMDDLLRIFAQVIDVDVMPGEFDPSNHVLPQQPIHSCVLPKSADFKSLNRVTNPYDCTVGGVRITGTSGQPIDDIMRYCDMKNGAEVLEGCLKWAHLAPTAPDTLGCYPHFEKDPFILRDCPHVLFAANRSKNFESKMVKGENGAEVRLISIPSFYSSCTVALLNLRTLECCPMSFLGNKKCMDPLECIDDDDQEFKDLLCTL